MSESISEVEKITGASEIEIGGRTVKVRMIKVRELDLMTKLVAAEDDMGLVALWTGEDKEWLNDLSVDEFASLLQEGERLNTAPFDRIQTSRTNRREMMFPGHRELLMKAAEGSLHPQPEPVPQVVSRDGSRTFPLPVDIPSPK